MSTQVEPVCAVCGVPSDAGFFDSSRVVDSTDPNMPNAPGEEVVLASYQLHRNYCGVLLYFAQFTDTHANNPREIRTPGFEWEIRCNGVPRDPYLRFDRIINPWGLQGFPIHLRLEEGCLVEFVFRALDPTLRPIEAVAGRLLGRYWYNSIYGGIANQVAGVASV